MFNKARPIISYTLSWNEKLGQFIGHLVFSLISSIFGDVSLDRKVVAHWVALGRALQQKRTKRKPHDISWILPTQRFASNPDRSPRTRLASSPASLQPTEKLGFASYLGRLQREKRSCRGFKSAAGGIPRLEGKAKSRKGAATGWIGEKSCRRAWPAASGTNQGATVSLKTVGSD